MELVSNSQHDAVASRAAAWFLEPVASPGGRRGCRRDTAVARRVAGHPSAPLYPGLTSTRSIGPGQTQLAKQCTSIVMRLTVSGREFALAIPSQDVAHGGVGSVNGVQLGPVPHLPQRRRR